MNRVDWFAVGLAASGVIVSVVSMATKEQDGTLSVAGGLLTWLAVGVAIYSFVTRSLK